MRARIGMPAIVFLAMVCSSHAISQSLAEYYPLKTGSEWILKGYGANPTITSTVIGTERINGVLYTVIEGKAVEEIGEQIGEQNVVYYERCEDNRVYRLKPNENEEHMMFDFNCDITQHWHTSYTSHDGSLIHIVGRPIGKEITVNVPAGEFENCIVFEVTDTRKKDGKIHAQHNTFWYAPRVGLVKMTFNLGGGSALVPVDFWVNDLTHYHIPGNE
jgi:hypothetical protein